MAKKLFLLLAFVAIAWVAKSQNLVIQGIVRDSVTTEPLPYVSVLLKGTTIGTTTGIDGDFYLTTSAKAQEVEVSYLGYETKTLKVTPGRKYKFTVELRPTSIDLSEVVVKPKKEKYSKKENPAVIFVKKVIERREANDPRNQPYFQYDQYEKMVMAMNDYQPKAKKDSTKVGKFDFLVDFVDTLEMGKTILPVSEKETVQKVYYRSDPKSEKRVIQGAKSAGVDEIFSRDGIQQFLGEVFREVNIFQNDIPLFLNRFVSPLSTMGPNFYKYYLLDTLEVDGHKTVDLGFVPFNSEGWGFTGHLYVSLDSTFFVERVKLNVPKDINLNFVGGMSIDQTFERLPDGTRLITKDDINVDFKLSQKSKGMYARRLNIYSNHSFEQPDETVAQVFEQSAPVITVQDAYRKDEAFWDLNRPEAAGKKKENTVEKLMARLRSVPIFYITEKVVSILVSGYIPTNKDPLKSKFEFGPMNTTVSGNALEGARFRVGGATTTSFSNRLFLDGYMAYGTKDKKLKYDGLVEYSFVDKKQYRKDFPVHSIRAEYSYDVNQLGQQYMYTSKDNVFLAWKRQKDDRITYLRNAELTYYREHYNGLAYGAVVRNKKETATEYVGFRRFEADGSINPIKDYMSTELELKLRFAPNEKFYQTRNFRYPITFDAPVFTLSHTMALKDFLGSDYTYQKTELGIQKRFWFSAFGYIDMIVKGGKLWNKVPYPLLLLPNANLSYTVQPESYTCMNAMEFMNDEYASWDVTYYMNGALLNRLPLIKKLKWREVFSFRGLYGHLTDKNNPFLTDMDRTGLYEFPAGSYVMGDTPYMEAGVGVENIFKFLRLDYVWRLTYKDHPNIQTKGVRFMMRLTF
ncbi:MAG: DUF5686 family protein [Parabacteroides sp.]